MNKAEQQGVELVVKGFAGFLAQLGAAAKAVDSFGKKTEAAAVKSSVAAGAVGELNKQITSLNRRAGSASSNMAAMASSVSALGKAARTFSQNSGAMQQFVTSFSQAGGQAGKLTQSIQQLTANLESYMGTKDRAMQNTSGFSLVMDVLGGVANRVSGILGGVLRGAFSALGGVLAGVKSAIEGLISPLASFAKRVAEIAAGISLVDFLRGVGNRIKELSGDVAAAASNFQKLTIQFTTLAARDIADETGQTIAASYGAASERAQQLLAWVKEIAVTTPFTGAEIARTLAMANAMGLSIGAAQRLTLAVGDFTAAMGLEDETMYRIIYNFGQMQAMGKITGREIRDLATSFVPMERILKEMAAEVGMNADEFRKLALEGGVPVQRFFEKFIDMAEHDFPGAMEKMSQTMQGVENNFRDFLELVIGSELLGPVWDRMAASASKALKSLLTGDIRRSFQLIGQVLGRAFDTVAPAIDNLVQAVGAGMSNILRAMGIAQGGVHGFGVALAFMAILASRAFTALANLISDLISKHIMKLPQLANNMRTWGFNLIQSFANGMAAAVVAVVKVLSAIIRVITSFLQAHSPPKALPDLPKWGMAAMASYLHGFTEADFTILESVQGPIKDALSILTETGQIGEIAAGKTFRDISVALARALSSGTVDEGLLAKIAGTTKPLGALGKEIAELVRRQLALAGASAKLERQQRALTIAEEAEERVARRLKLAQEVERDFQRKLDAAKAAQDAAERRVEEAKKRESDTRAGLNAQVREYNQLLRSGGDKSALQLKLRQVNAQEQVARQATEARKNAELEVEAAKFMVEAAKAQVEAARRRIEELETARERAQDVVDLEQSRLEKIQAENEELERQIKLQEELVQQLIDITRAQIIQPETPETGGEGAATPAEEEGAFGALPPLGGLGVEDFTGEIDSIFKEAEGLVDAFLAQISQAWEDLKKKIDTKGLGKQFQDLWDQLSKIDWAGAVGKLGDLWTLIFGNEKKEGWIDRIDWAKLGSDIRTFTDGVGSFLTLMKDSAWPIIRDNLDRINTSFKNLTGSTDAIKAILVALAIPVFAITIALAGLSGAVASTMEWMDKIRTKLGLAGLSFDTLGNTVKSVAALIIITLTAPFVFIGGFVEGVIKFFENLRERLVGRSIIPEMMQRIYDVITGKLTAIANWIPTKLGEIAGTFRTKFEEFRGIAQSKFEEIRGIADGFVNDVKTNISTGLEAIRTNWDERMEGYRATAQEKFDAIHSRIETIRESIETSVETLTGNVKTAWDGILSGAGSIVNAWSGAWDSINKKISDIATPIKNTIQGIIDKIGNAIDNITNLNDKKVGQNTIPKGGGSTPPGTTTLPPHAGGGRMRAGEPGIVGERGWEMWMPDVNGWIMNQQQLKAVVAGALMRSAVAAGPRVAGVSGDRVVNVNFNGLTISNGMEQAQFEARVVRVIRKEFS